MSQNLEEKYQLLLEKIKQLEEENNALSERAEESLLLRLVAETISTVEKEDTLLESVLEKISIIKNIPFCTCFEMQKEKLLLVSQYIDFSDSLPANFRIKLDTDLINDLKTGPCKIINFEKDSKITIKNLSAKFKPYAAILIPFSTRIYPSGLFVFIDNKKSATKLSSMIILLQNIVQMIEDRLDKLSLLKELKNINDALEHRIEKRTDELRISNQNLRKEVAERKRVLAALRESEEKFREIFDKANDAMYLWQLKTDGSIDKCIEVNENACKMTGYSKEELLKFTPEMLDDHESRKKVSNILKKLHEKGSSTFTATHVAKNGTLIPVEISAHIFMLQQKRVILSITRDISERLMAEDQLRKLSQSVEQSPVSVVITDVYGNIEYVNPKFSQVTGYSSDEAMGKNPRILKSGAMSGDNYKYLWETITAGREWQGEFQNKRKNGELYWENASISPIKSNSGEITHFIAVKEDITERKRLQQQLIQAQKMESIGNLAGGIAHDFNNLLTVINGHAEISLMKLEKDHPSHRDLISILHAGKRAENLTRQLLAFSRKQIYETKIINLNEVITGLDKLLRRLIGENIEIKINLMKDLPPVKADPGQIEQIMMNLAVNARDAINDLGESAKEKIISIETGIELIDEGTLKKYPEMSVEEKIFISIKDTGIGIPKDLKDKIFEPFFTTKEKGKGTGLGLSTVYGIVKQNQGYIYVISDEMSGTHFKIYWPVSKEKVNKEIKKYADQKNLEGTEHLLFVEDDDAIRNLVGSALRAKGYHVLEASNGREALEIFDKENHNINLVITDLIMPVMNGKELVNKILKQRQDISIIYTSGYTNDHIVSEGELKEGLIFVAKPYSISTLAEKIREILDTKPA